MPRKKKSEEVKKETVIVEVAEPKIAEEVKTENEALQTEELTSSEKKADKYTTFAKPTNGYFFGVGRRKTATARARLYLPDREVVISETKLNRGDVFINGKSIDLYFPNAFTKNTFNEVYRTTNTIGRFITTIIVSGSGGTGQLGAVTLSVARALCQVDPRFRPILRKRGFLTRDPRMKERKKPGLMGARKQKSSPKR